MIVLTLLKTEACNILSRLIVYKYFKYLGINITTINKLFDKNYSRLEKKIKKWKRNI